MQITATDWQAAKQHFDTIRQIYLDLDGTPGVNTRLALNAVFRPLAIRYNTGERSPDLYEAMKAVE